MGFKENWCELKFDLEIGFNVLSNDTTSVILDTTSANELRIDSSNGCLDCAKTIKPKEAPITSKDVYKVLKSFILCYDHKIIVG